MYKSLGYFTPALLWALLIALLSSNAPIEELPFDWYALFRIDIIGHFVFYAVLCVAFIWALEQVNTANEKHLYINGFLAFAIATLYGISMEFFQLYYWEGRHYDYLDMLANTLGALLGVYIFNRFKNIIPWTSTYQD